ncbi:MAG: hypothetical protein HY913_01375 [Desulfomonile tiedjei]|nr:hypothetical protein [Desulfomonile tiedjei]
MKKTLILFGILLMALVPCAAIGQGVQPLYPMAPPQVGPGPGMPGMAPPGPGMPGMTGMAPWAPFPGGIGQPNRQVFPDERWVISPWARAGYQWREFHANFPNNIQTINSARIFDSMDLDLVDNNFWVGFTGVELQPIQDIVLYGQIGANIPTNVRMNMFASGKGTAAAVPFTVIVNNDGPLLAGPFFAGENLDANLVPPWQWTAQNFTWWIAEAGAAWWVNSLYALEAGFRTEHVDFHLKDPRNNARRIDIEQNDPIPVYPGTEIICTRI